MNKNYLMLAVALGATVVITGCGKSVQPPLYTWGEYVNSSAKYAMYGHEKAVIEAHKAELKKIIEESEHAKQRVAPGIYAEYAQLLYQTNQKEDAKRYFKSEINTYPESKVFIDRVCTKLFGAAL